MKKGTIWTILGVIVAVVIAWWLVNVVFHVVFWLFKVAVVAVVALVVFLVLRYLFRSRREG